MGGRPLPQSGSGWIRASWQICLPRLSPGTCTPATVTRYQKRISGPLLDRMDIHVDVPRVAYEKLTDQCLGRRLCRAQLILHNCDAPNTLDELCYRG